MAAGLFYPLYQLQYNVVMLGVLCILISNIDSAESRKCRCLPGDSCWPTQADWDQLNTTLYGKLITPKPTGYPCYAGAGFDAKSCQQVKESYSEPTFVINNAGSNQVANWESLGQMRCAIEASGDVNAKCQQGRVSVYGVAATSVADIQAAMLFARQHNLRVVIKSTGHDSFGRASAPGSFMIWMRKFTKIESKMAFTPEGCDASQANNGPVVTVQGGVIWNDVYKQVDADFNGTYFVVGGICATVGAAGGFVQGGGHSILSPKFGLAVDNVLEYKIVTVDGKLLTANYCQNKDLFWALRGGGGGTFGVLVSATYKLHPVPQGHMAFSALVTNPDKSGNLSALQIQGILELIARHTENLDSNGWGGYFYANPAFGLILLFLAPYPETGGEQSQPIIRMESLRNELQGLQNRLGIIVSPVPPNSGTEIKRIMRFLEWKEFFDSSPISLIAGSGGRTYPGSRLIPLSAFSNPASVAQTVITAVTTNGLQNGVLGNLVSGRGVRDNPSAKETSVTPAWRRSAWHVIMHAPWAYDATDDQIEQAKARMNTATQVLRDAYPESGAYSNEAFVDEPDWQHAFWGDNYEKLFRIKQDVDPDGFLVCTECVGRELRDQSGNCHKAPSVHYYG